MKKLFVTAVFFGVLSAWAAEDQKPSNFLSAFYRFDQNVTDESRMDTVVLAPFTVTSGKSGDMSTGEKLDRSLERYFRKGGDDRISYSDRLIYFVPASAYPFRNDPADDVRHIFQSDQAVRFLGGENLFKNGTFYFHGGLMKRINRNVSTGIKSLSHGVKGLVLEIRW